MSTELVSRITSLGDAISDIKDNLGVRVSELEKRIAGHDDGGGYAAGQSLGELLSASPDVQRLNSDFRGKAAIRIDRAALTTHDMTVGSGRSSSTSLVPSQRVAEIITPPEQRFLIRDLIPAVATTAGTIDYAKETGFVNSARPVAEGTIKPVSELEFNMDSSKVQTIAHLFKASRQLMDDAPALGAYIERRARYGIKVKEEAQFFFGDGTGVNVNGIVPQARAYDTSRTAADDTELDVLLHAISQAEEAELPASAIVLSVYDWRRLLGVKDGDKRYLSGGPFGTTAPRIWDLPVYPTNTFTRGQFLLGAFSLGAQIFDRMEVEVLLSSENNDDFEKNMFTVRAEERTTIAVYRDEAFVTGNLRSPE